MATKKDSITTWSDITDPFNITTYTKAQLEGHFGISYDKVNNGYKGRFEVCQSPLPTNLGGTNVSSLQDLVKALQDNGFGNINEQRNSTQSSISSDFYSGGSYDTSAGITSEELSRRLKYLFPNGVPTTKEEADSYLVSVSFPMVNYDGVKTTSYATVHKLLADDFKEIMTEIADAGIKLKNGGSYNYRKMASGSLSHHSYGVCIDLNVPENPQYAPSVAPRAGVSNSILYNASEDDSRWSSWNAVWNQILNEKHNNSEYRLENTQYGTSAKDIFLKHGWFWGGNWAPPWTDIMHFSWTDH